MLKTCRLSLEPLDERVMPATMVWLPTDPIIEQYANNPNNWEKDGILSNRAPEAGDDLVFRYNRSNCHLNLSSYNSITIESTYTSSLIMKDTVTLVLNHASLEGGGILSKGGNVLVNDWAVVTEDFTFEVGINPTNTETFHFNSSGQYTSSIAGMHSQGHVTNSGSMTMTGHIFFERNNLTFTNGSTGNVTASGVVSGVSHGFYQSGIWVNNGGTIHVSSGQFDIWGGLVNQGIVSVSAGRSVHITGTVTASLNGISRTGSYLGDHGLLRLGENSSMLVSNDVHIYTGGIEVVGEGASIGNAFGYNGFHNLYFWTAALDLSSGLNDGSLSLTVTGSSNNTVHFDATSAMRIFADYDLGQATSLTCNKLITSGSASLIVDIDQLPEIGWWDFIYVDDDSSSFFNSAHATLPIGHFIAVVDGEKQRLVWTGGGAGGGGA